MLSQQGLFGGHILNWDERISAFVSKEKYLSSSFTSLSLPILLFFFLLSPNGVTRWIEAIALAVELYVGRATVRPPLPLPPTAPSFSFPVQSDSLPLYSFPFALFSSSCGVVEVDAGCSISGKYIFLPFLFSFCLSGLVFKGHRRSSWKCNRCEEARRGED